MAGYVFVSYSHLDRAYVDKLQAHLTATGIEVWTDQSIVRGGQWPREIESRLMGAAAVVAVMSAHSRAADWVDRELDLAQELGKPILPLLLDGGVFLRLRDVQHEDVTSGRMPSPDYTARLRELTASTQARYVVTASMLQPRLIATVGNPRKAGMALAWSPDGRMLATTYTNQAFVRDGDTLALLYTVSPQLGINSIAWSPDGRELATACHNGVVKIWDARTGSLSSTIKAGWSASDVAWSGDGRLLAVANHDKVVRIWRADCGGEFVFVHNLTGHTGEVKALNWSPDDTWLATAGEDGVACVWDPHRGELVRAASANTGRLHAVAWSPDGRTLAAAGKDGVARFWNPVNGNLLRTLAGHSAYIWSVAWSPRGDLFATGSFDGTVRIWDPTTGSTVVTLAHPAARGSAFNRWDSNPRWRRSLSFAPDGQRIATSDLDNVVRIWDLAASATDTIGPGGAAT